MVKTGVSWCCGNHCSMVHFCFVVWVLFSVFSIFCIMPFTVSDQLQHFPPSLLHCSWYGSVVAIRSKQPASVWHLTAWSCGRPQYQLENAWSTPWYSRGGHYKYWHGTSSCSRKGYGNVCWMEKTERWRCHSGGFKRSPGQNRKAWSVRKS